MKKDYIAVSQSDSAYDETAFVDEFWTNVWDGRNFQQFPGREIEKREEFKIMEPYIATLSKGARMLDGGCGLGKWTLYYASRGFDVIGLDLSAKTVAQLKSRFARANFVVGDIRKTHFPDNSFDAYFSWGTFEHFEIGLGPCFAEARRILKPGGYLFITLPFQSGNHLRRDSGPLERWDEAFDAAKGYTSEMRFYQWRLTKGELAREFEINGFRCLEVQPIHKAHGLHRAIKHDLGINSNSPLHRALQILLYPLVPKSYIAHMLMGVGQKR